MSLTRPTPSPILFGSTRPDGMRAYTAAKVELPVRPSSQDAMGGEKPTNMALLRRLHDAEKQLQVQQNRCRELEEALRKCMEERSILDVNYYVVPSIFIPPRLYERHRAAIDILIEFALEFRTTEQHLNESRCPVAKGDASEQFLGSSEHVSQKDQELRDAKRRIRILLTENEELKEKLASLLQQVKGN